jgi:ribonuclease HII
MKKIKYIIGIDEAGRGPLAGPLTVAAIAFKLSKTLLVGHLVSKRTLNVQIKRNFKDIKDSKKLSPQKREEYLSKFKSESRIFTTTASVSHQIIDNVGITKATDLAVKRVIRNMRRKIKIKPQNTYFLLDGLLKAPKKFSQETIIKGDEKIPLISAASIVAKVSRDRKMIRLHKKFSGYGFNRHKGYGTKFHRKTIEKYGLCEIHRRSYCNNIIFKL